MKYSIKIPSTNYSNLFDIARYDLTWRFGIFALLSLIFFNLTLLLTVGKDFILPSGIAITVTVLALGLMYNKKKYEFTATIFCIIGTILTNYFLYAFPQISHLVDFVWIITLVIFSYFTLGKKIGLIILIIDFLSIGIYIFFFLNINVEVLVPLKLIDKLPLFASATVCFSLLSYILYLFVATTKKAENEYLELTKELKAKNKEKSVLIKEIHHRVKNNLQVIISLLRLQSNEVEIENQKKPFRDTVNRVIAMSLIHEKIYQSPDLAHINIEEYIRTLGVELIDSLSIDKAIEFKIKSNVHTVKPKSLIPLALIFNELISNSLKHGFKDVQSGQISLEIINDFPNTKMIYKDSGVWIPNNESNTLGVDLIQSLTDQLNGTITKNTQSGTEYIFYFE